MDFACLEADIEWLRDETFFSLCSRLHLLSGNLRPSATAAQLLSLSERCIKHDLPCGMDAFERNSAGRWGDARLIIEQHTIFPFFAPFQSHVAVNDALTRLRSPVMGPLKYQLGLVCGGFGADHPLKACLSCMKRDIELCGVSYWHLDHQYPGVVICSTHMEVLRECTRNRRWCGRFSWTLPEETTLRDMGYGALTNEERQKLALLSDACRDLASVGLNQNFDSLRVVHVYRRSLTKDGASESLLAHLLPLRRFHPYGGLPDTAEVAGSFIAQMARSPRRHVHPLKHLVMLTWLFGDVPSFAQCYEECFRQPATSDLRDEIIQPPGNLAPTGVTTGAPRPKRLKPELRAVLLKRLAEGVAKQLICDEFQINISTVNRLLRSERGVQASWSSRQIALGQAHHRSRWSDLWKLFPTLPLSELRMKSPSLYAWLYRNDRKWLSLQTAQMPKPCRSRPARVDWYSRDDCLLRQLRAELIRKYGADKDMHLKQSQIFALMPRLAQRLERRDRYPRTRAYVKLLSIP
ncbi:TnsD family Tn7-like transposition protein [Pseudomonas sp. EA_65y_Pfl1_P120]|uniref:TnsD family Tn7-like transposition protein n=1 Tax=Pseudomonas sp. EA_65y_Pfl1_P120 TaxID=3088693 RepID=UPI00403F080F